MGCNEDHSNKKTQESQRFTVQDSEKLLGQMTSDKGYGLVFGTMNLDPNNPSAIDYIKDQPSIFDYLNTTVTNKIGD